MSGSNLTIAAERQRKRVNCMTLSQGLAGIILQLEAADAHLAGDNAGRARTILQATLESARSTLGKARMAISDLRSPATANLEQAASQEVERFIAATASPVILTSLSKQPCEISEFFIRAIVEGLTNIARHSHANNASLGISPSTGTNELVIILTDDGIGFDTDKVQAGHYGLLGMKERVRLAGGHLEITSGMGEGTRVEIHLPMEESANG
jgi:NarL family two-component system sensor histidine kinase YdfH